MILILFISILTLLLLIFNLIIYVSLRQIKPFDDPIEEFPSVSVVIAARNEEKNALQLINALSIQNYPELHYEVIIVDDNSDDNTFNHFIEAIKDKPNFKLIKAQNEDFAGKRGALLSGIKSSMHDIILITDADCIPEKNWIRSLVIKITEGYDLVFGISPFYQTNSLPNKVSCFENFRGMLLTFSAAQLKMPYSAAARNLGFRKQLFEEIGGYKNTTDTLSGDDDLLIREAVKAGAKIGVVNEYESMVLSQSKETFSEYFNQRARHTETSFHYLLRHKILLSCWHLLNICAVLSAFLFFADSIFLAPILIKLTIDVVMTEEYMKKFGYRFTYSEIVYLQLMYEVFLIIHFIKARYGKFAWK